MKFHSTDDTFGVILQFDRENIDPAELRKRIHDLRASLRTLGLCVENLREGYTFNDQLASAKIEALSKASSQLDQEGQFLEKIYQGLIDRSAQE